jgi:hypothetical protein
LRVENRHDTGRLARRGDLDGAKSRVRMLAAQEGRVQHAVDVDIVEELAAAAQ